MVGLHVDMDPVQIKPKVAVVEMKAVLVVTAVQSCCKQQMMLKGLGAQTNQRQSPPPCLLAPTGGMSPVRSNPVEDPTATPGDEVPLQTDAFCLASISVGSSEGIDAKAWSSGSKSVELPYNRAPRTTLKDCIGLKLSA